MPLRRPLQRQTAWRRDLKDVYPWNCHKARSRIRTPCKRARGARPGAPPSLTPVSPSTWPATSWLSSSRETVCHQSQTWLPRRSLGLAQHSETRSLRVGKATRALHQLPERPVTRTALESIGLASVCHPVFNKGRRIERSRLAHQGRYLTRESAAGDGRPSAYPLQHLARCLPPLPLFSLSLSP